MSDIFDGLWPDGPEEGIDDGYDDVAIAQYECQSYYNDNNELQDCTCGKCE